MTQAEASDPVRRKIRSVAQSTAGPVDDRQARLWRQIVARALKAAVGLNVQVGEVVVSAVLPDDLPGLPDDGDMTLLMENGEGDVGLALVDPAVLAALIEMQTIGRVTERPPARRAPTPTDGALVGPVLDRLLTAGAKGLAESGQRDPVTDFRFAMLTEKGAPPTLALADLLHKCLSLDLRIEGGAKVGRLRFLVPDTGATEDQKAAGRADWSQKISQAVLASDLTLEARMGRVRLSIEEVMALAVDDLLPFPREALQQVRLMAGGGDTVARGRLGQSSGFRAIKIQSEQDDQTPDPGWTQGAARIDKA